MENNSLCILPFIHLSTRTNGDMQLCCHANSAGTAGNSMPGCNRDKYNIINLTDANPKDYWNTDFYKNIRKDMLSGKKPKACSICYKEEESGYKSKRIWETEEWSKKIDFNKIISTVKEDGSMPYNIKYIDMKLGNKCNLACIMCNPHDSHLLAKEFELIKGTSSNKLKSRVDFTKDNNFNWWRDNNTYWDSIWDNLSELREVYIIGGEPTINSEFRIFLEKCVQSGDSKHIKLRFNTNGHNIDDTRLHILYPEFEEVLMHLSMDGIEEYHEYIRYPSKWSKMQEILTKHDKLAENKNITVDLDCTVSILNVEHIPDFIKWKVNSNFMNINKVSFRGLIGIHLLHHPSYLSVQTLKTEDKQRIENKYTELKVWLLENESEKASKYPKLDAVINYMNSYDNSDEIETTREYLNEMNKLRQNKLNIKGVQ